MQDFELIEIVESVRRRLSEQMDDLDTQLSRCVWTDFRTAPAWDLMAALAQLITGLDGRRPAEARKIQAWINRAYAVGNAAGATSTASGTGNGRSPWVIRESQAAPESPDNDIEWPDEFQAQAIRYLSLSAFYVNDAPQSDDAAGAPVDVPRINNAGAPTSSPDGGADVLTRHTAAPVPTRFGQELAQCSDVGEALALVKKRLPRLKPMLACQFLSVIGFTVAPPLPDVVRLCEHLGLMNAAPTEAKEPAAADQPRATPAAPQQKTRPRITAQAAELTAILQRAARLACVPLAHVVHLLSLYSGAQAGSSDVRAAAVCLRTQPACSQCGLTKFCSRHPHEQQRLAAPSPAGRPARGISIKQWAVDERPRERLLAGERLSNSELLGIILRTGSGGLSAVELARKVIGEFGTLHDLQKASPGEIIARLRGSGIGPAKAAEICAAIELGRRATQPAADTRTGLRSVLTSRDIFETYRSRFKTSVQEEFLLLVLDSRMRIQKEIMVSMGTVNTSMAHPRDVFRLALREAAVSVMFIHNHPSGDPTPSEQDLALTARLSEAGRLLGIDVTDHIIIGSHEWYSFRDHGRMP